MATNKEVNKKAKKIVFSEKIDDNINGYSAGFTFIAIALFLFWRQDYLRFEVVTRVVGIIVAALGILVCSIQLSKTIQIEGLTDFSIGAVAFFAWLILYLKVNWLIVNLVSITFLTFGLYGMIRGIMEISYSVWTKIIVTTEEKSKSVKAKEVFLLITQIFGFALTILNILKIFGVVGA